LCIRYGPRGSEKEKLKGRGDGDIVLWGGLEKRIDLDRSINLSLISDARRTERRGNQGGWEVSCKGGNSSWE